MAPLITRNRLDAVFDKALVLLGILAAAELAYVTAIPLPPEQNAQLVLQHLKDFTFKATTFPFIILILTWMIKELYVKITGNIRWEYFITLFCWDLWSYSLYGFLAILYGLIAKPTVQYSAILGGIYIGSIFLASAVFIIMIAWAYSKTLPIRFPSSRSYKRAAVLASAFALIPFAIIFMWALMSF